jgi:ATP-independent RNA helicase DbpA
VLLALNRHSIGSNHLKTAMIRHPILKRLIFMPTTDFSALNLRPELQLSLKNMGYDQQTQIQELSLPALLEGKDVVAQAQTGSGKTAAYGIALLNKLQEKTFTTQALIVCPTRELADQVAEEIRSLAKSIANMRVVVLCGGKSMGPQLASLKRAPHVVVGTPGRLLKHLQKNTLTLSEVQTVVLDEADRMLDMGFEEDVQSILDFTSPRKQLGLFSATFPAEIKTLSLRYQTSPDFIQVAESTANQEIRQEFFEVELNHRVPVLIKLLNHYQPESTLIFCNTILKCQELADELRRVKVHATALHGELEQFKRDQVLAQFSNRSSAVLVATDVAARGLDIKDLQLVINFEISRDPDTHVHRIGRTGRAGNQGVAVSLFSRGEWPRVEMLGNLTSTVVHAADISKLKPMQAQAPQPAMVTVFFSAGRKEKIRPGDILGALTKQLELPGDSIGKIDVLDKVTYVAISRELATPLFSSISDIKIKGRTYRAKLLR